MSVEERRHGHRSAVTTIPPVLGRLIVLLTAAVMCVALTAIGAPPSVTSLGTPQLSLVSPRLNDSTPTNVTDTATATATAVSVTATAVGAVATDTPPSQDSATLGIAAATSIPSTASVAVSTLTTSSTVASTETAGEISGIGESGAETDSPLHRNRRRSAHTPTDVVAHPPPEPLHQLQPHQLQPHQPRDPAPVPGQGQGQIQPDPQQLATTTPSTDHINGSEAAKRRDNRSAPLAPRARARRDGAGTVQSPVPTNKRARRRQPNSRLRGLDETAVSPDRVALVVVAGSGRHDAATAVVESWGKWFEKRLIVTNTNETEGFGKGLAPKIVNVFSDAPTLEAQTKKYIHPHHPWMRFRGTRNGKHSHSLQWHLAQPRFLLGLERLVEWYPASTVDWYLVVDTDTFIFPDRLLTMLGELPDSPRTARMMVGSLFKMSTDGSSKSLVSTMLGGSGVAISAAAVSAVDLHFCAREQSTNVNWNRVGGDWRLSLCLESAKIQMIDAHFMLMVDEKFTCGTTGPKGCFQRYTRQYRYPTSLECPISLHYMSPSRMRELERERGATTQLCLPHMTAKASGCKCTDR
eukprot:m.313975 g.313975  ORF g.313975 m.313975 type:complete len:579 (-) comp27491_c0_seq1:325-2061(-)